mgnify:CR=1 FL=1
MGCPHPKRGAVDRSGHAIHSLRRLENGMLTSAMSSASMFLIRYGVIPEVARFANPQVIRAARGDVVVVKTHRGQELGMVLEALRAAAEPRSGEPEAATGDILRTATEADHARAAELRTAAVGEFPGWEHRIAEWKLDLQLVDLEWTLDRARLVGDAAHFANDEYCADDWR